MAHTRRRYLAQTLSSELKWAPVVGILGMRQTGKTTLIQSFAKSYYSFDSLPIISQFERGSENLLEQGPFPVGLDEVQKFPPLFDTLKLLVDRKRVPGRFLLTGSVRFSSKRSIRESLTGRISILELLPLSLAESHDRKIGIFLSAILKHDGEALLSAVAAHAWAKDDQIMHYLQTGGLPGICFKRNTVVREKLFKNHLDTLFGRDIRHIYETELSITKLEDLYSVLCDIQGEPVRYSQLARQIGSTPPTLKKIVDAMEGLFLIRRYGDSIFAEDLGLATFSMRFKSPRMRQQILRFVYAELRAQVQYLFPTQCKIRPYTTRGGIDIPFLVEFQDGTKVAICVEADEKISDKTSKSIIWFRKKFPKAKGIIVYLGEKPLLLPSKIHCIPWGWVP